MAITKNSFLKITPITPDIGGVDTTTSIERTFTHRVEDLTTLGVYFDGQLIQADTEPVILTDAKFYYTVSTSLTTVNAGSFVIGDWYQIKTTGDTNFVSVGADSTTVGVAFIATGIGSGTGTAYALSKTTPGTDTITIAIKPNSTYRGVGYASGSSTSAFLSSDSFLVSYYYNQYTEV